jgi:hypothetical protein
MSRFCEKLSPDQGLLQNLGGGSLSCGFVLLRINHGCSIATQILQWPGQEGYST